MHKEFWQNSCYCQGLGTDPAEGPGPSRALLSLSIASSGNSVSTSTTCRGPQGSSDHTSSDLTSGRHTGSRTCCNARCQGPGHQPISAPCDLPRQPLCIDGLLTSFSSLSSPISPHYFPEQLNLQGNHRCWVTKEQACEDWSGGREAGSPHLPQSRTGGQGQGWEGSGGVRSGEDVRERQRAQTGRTPTSPSISSAEMTL